MICPQCHNVLPDSAQFCPGCGYRFPVQVPSAAPPYAPPASPYAPPPASPYAAPPGQPYVAPPGSPYAPPPGQPYAAPPGQPAGGVYGSPYPAPPYGQPPPGVPPYGAPPYPGAGVPYGAPSYGPLPGPVAPPLPPPSIEEICARGYTIQVGKWVSEGWQIIKPVLWPMIGFLLITNVISNATGGLSLLIYGPLMAGAYLVPLRRLKGRPHNFGSFFDGFRAFVPLFLLSLVSGLLVFTGMLFLILPGIYLSVAFGWAQLLVIDRGMDFWPALMASMKVVNRNFWGTLGFFLIAGLLASLGLLACCVGYLFTWPWLVGMQLAAYRDIFGVSPGPDRCESGPNVF
jgi:hypothetical protein